MHAMPSAVISAIVFGTSGQRRRGVPPFSAASMMTGVTNSEELGEQLANFRRALLRQVLVYTAYDEFAEIVVQGFAQQPEQVGRRDENNSFELCVNASVFEAPGDFARELGSLPIARGVRVSERVSIRGTAGFVARQIPFVCARFRVYEIFEFVQRTAGCFNCEDART